MGAFFEVIEGSGPLFGPVTLDDMSVAPSMLVTLSNARLAAGTDCNILLAGETGVGKELMARAIHNASGRTNHPLHAINCSAFPEGLIEAELFGSEKGAFTGANERRAGLFERANNGTLFLDEIGEMPILQQSKLLRVLEERRLRRLGGKSELSFDIRLISGSNRDLSEAIANNKFRQDLYFRINTIVLEIPPLRDRLEDIPFLSERFLYRHARDHDKAHLQEFAPGILDHFRDYSWPGNIRQLNNIIERCVILCAGPTITFDLLKRAVDMDGARMTARHVGGSDVEQDAAQTPGKEWVKITGPDGKPRNLNETIGDIVAQSVEITGTRQEAGAHLGISRQTVGIRLANRKTRLEP